MQRLLTLGLGLLLALAAHHAVAKPVVQLVGDNWCPYNCASDAESQGYLVDLVREILGADYDVRYSTEAWTRAAQLTAERPFHILLGTTPSTTPTLRLGAPVGVDRTCFFVRRDSGWHYRVPADLRRHRLGVVQDYNYDADGPIDKLLARLRRESSGRIDIAQGSEALISNFHRLVAGKTDIVLENDNVGRHTLRTLALDKDLRHAGCAPHYLGTLHLAVMPTHAESAQLLQRIDEGIAALRTSGRLQQLLGRYGIADWQPLLKKSASAPALAGPAPR